MKVAPLPPSRKERIRSDNDRASAGGLVGLFILFIVCGAFIAFLGPVVDRTTDANNQMIGMPGLPVSQDRIDTLGTLGLGFSIMGGVILIALGFNYWVASIRDQNTEV